MSNKNDESQKTFKPAAVSKHGIARTVSAQATFNADTYTIPSTSTSLTNNVQDKSGEGVKLNINANAFVPKGRRSDNVTDDKKDNKETIVPQNVTQSTSYTTTNNSYVSTGGFPQATTNPMYNPRPSLQTVPGSMIQYTYLNPTGMYNQIGYGMNMPGYSPNTRTGTFFPSGNYNMGMQPNIPYNAFPYQTGQNVATYPTQQTNITNPTTMGSIPNVQNTTTNVPAANTEKRITFNKDAPIFVPKGMKRSEEEKNEKLEKVEERTDKQEKIEEKTEKIDVKQEEKISATLINEENSSNIKQNVIEVIETKEKDESRKTSTSNVVDHDEKKIESQPEDSKLISDVDSKKVEKPKKLKDLLSLPEEQPALGPKSKKSPLNQNQNTVIVTNNKPKQNDIYKSFEEKRKKLLSMQKEDKNKPIVQPTKKNMDRTRELEKAEEKVTATEEQENNYIESEEPSFEEEIEVPAKVKNFKIERCYFLVDEEPEEKKTKHIYSIDYLLSFKNWRICGEDRLLNNMLKDHVEAMKIYEDERPKGHKKVDHKKKKEPSDKFLRGSTNNFDDRDKDRITFTRSTIKTDTPIVTVGGEGTSLGKWGRKDMSEAERMAQEFKEKMEEEKKKDPVRNKLTEFLNILTVDNFAEIKQNIFEMIKENVEDQYKFLEVLFKKAVSERTYVTIYAKLCKELDREMPQKSEKDIRASMMRTKLLDTCREIFRTENNTKIDQYIKVTDPEEREAKLKKFLLGNVNFIGELIKSKILSKKIVFQCINNLLARIEKSEEQTLIKQINLEAIVILLDKFGTLINNQNSSIKMEELVEFNKRIDEYLENLDFIQENDKDIPSPIKYKIINLIEKKKRGWEETKVDKTTSAKGMKEVREEYESEQRGPNRSVGGNKLDQDQVNAKIREDLWNWRDHIKNGYNSGKYNWNITDTLINKYKNTLGEILTAFGENCIDFIEKQDDLNYAYLYIREIISYFFKNLDKKEKMELNDVTLYFLQNLSDFSLDNNLLVDVWGGVIYLLEYYKIFYFSDLEKLKDINDEQLKSIFEAFSIALGYYENKEDKMKELYSISLIKANKSLFQSIIEQSSD